MTQIKPSSFNSRSLITFDGIKIHLTETFDPSHSQTLLILHGASEHGERYEEFAEYLFLHQVNCVMMDLRGYGHSGGKRAFWKDFNAITTDVCMVASDILERGQKLHLLGHSLGGLVAARTASTLLKNKLSTLNLSSPCFALVVEIPKWKKLIAEALSLCMPTYLFSTPIRPDVLTHDKSVITTYLADPLMTHRMSARLFCELQLTMSECLEFAAKISCPTMILQAGDDKVVSSTQSKIFFDHIKHADKIFKVAESAYHEILQETNRGAYFNDFLKHIQQHSGSPL